MVKKRKTKGRICRQCHRALTKDEIALHKISRLRLCGRCRKERVL